MQREDLSHELDQNTHGDRGIDHQLQGKETEDRGQTTECEQRVDWILTFRMNFGEDGKEVTVSSGGERNPGVAEQDRERAGERRPNDEPGEDNCDLPSIERFHEQGGDVL